MKNIKTNLFILITTMIYLLKNINCVKQIKLDEKKPENEYIKGKAKRNKNRNNKKMNLDFSNYKSNSDKIDKKNNKNDLFLYEVNNIKPYIGKNLEKSFNKIKKDSKEESSNLLKNNYDSDKILNKNEMKNLQNSKVINNNKFSESDDIDSSALKRNLTERKKKTLPISENLISSEKIKKKLSVDNEFDDSFQSIEVTDQEINFSKENELVNKKKDFSKNNKINKQSDSSKADKKTIQFINKNQSIKKNFKSINNNESVFVNKKKNLNGNEIKMNKNNFLKVNDIKKKEKNLEYENQMDSEYSMDFYSDESTKFIKNTLNETNPNEISQKVQLDKNYKKLNSIHDESFEDEFTHKNFAGSSIFKSDNKKKKMNKLLKWTLSKSNENNEELNNIELSTISKKNYNNKLKTNELTLSKSKSNENLREINNIMIDTYSKSKNNNNLKSDLSLSNSGVSTKYFSFPNSIITEGENIKTIEKEDLNLSNSQEIENINKFEKNNKKDMKFEENLNISYQIDSNSSTEEELIDHYIKKPKNESKINFLTSSKRQINKQFNASKKNSGKKFKFKTKENSKSSKKIPKKIENKLEKPNSFRNIIKPDFKNLENLPNDEKKFQAKQIYSFGNPFKLKSQFIYNLLVNNIPINTNENVKKIKKSKLKKKKINFQNDQNYANKCLFSFISIFATSDSLIFNNFSSFYIFDEPLISYKQDYCLKTKSCCSINQKNKLLNGLGKDLEKEMKNLNQLIEFLLLLMKINDKKNFFEPFDSNLDDCLYNQKDIFYEIIDDLIKKEKKIIFFYKEYIKKMFRKSLDFFCALCNPSNALNFYYSRQYKKYFLKINFEAEYFEFYQTMNEFAKFRNLIKLEKILECLMSAKNENLVSFNISDFLEDIEDNFEKNYDYIKTNEKFKSYFNDNYMPSHHFILDFSRIKTMFSNIFISKPKENIVYFSKFFIAKYNPLKKKSIFFEDLNTYNTNLSKKEDGFNLNNNLASESLKEYTDKKIDIPYLINRSLFAHFEYEIVEEKELKAVDKLKIFVKEIFQNKFLKKKSVKIIVLTNLFIFFFL